MTTRMGQVVRNSDEWTAMWRGLATGYDIDEIDEETGESWQYMGSHDEGAGWRRGFRHRSLQGQRLCVNVGATAGWAPAKVYEYDLDTMPF